MNHDAILRDFASRCRRMARSEHDRRLRTIFLRMAEDYERRAEQHDELFNGD